MTARDLLLEVGVEELPARFVPPALEALKDAAEKRFSAAGLRHKGMKTLGTPRRLALLVTALAEKAEDQVLESLGPAAAQAKDADGNWTPAAQGFARGQGTTPEKLEIRETDRGPRLCAVKRVAGQPAAKILPALLPALIRGIPFPKSMVWEESRTPFARPIRWIVALHDKAVVRFSLAGVNSGNRTLGLRIHGKKALPVPAPAKYAGLLKDRLVIVDPAERRELIEKQVQQAVKPVHGHVSLEAHAALLEEVVCLVEHPVAVLGKFDAAHLSLPAEVLVTSMKKHQKYFPVFDAQGKLLPHFVAIRNGVSENQAVVREGYERVLAARLSDAKFFFTEDRKARLMDRGDALEGVKFFDPLTMKDKVRRVRRLASALAEDLSLAADVVSMADRIASLGKADLVTGMVGEFPELQGVMGRLYAAAEGEDPSVARGIEEHYWPLTAEGVLPSSEAAALVSLADKLDTLGGNFLLGKVPSGSQDPYGLRRASIGMLRVLEARGWGLDLGGAAAKAMAGVAEGLRTAGKDMSDKEPAAGKTLLDFLKQRWAALKESEGFRHDEVQAVTAGAFSSVPDAGARLEALRDVRRHPDFEPLAAAFKRAANILKQARQKNIDFPSEPSAPALREPAEKDLFASLQGVPSALTTGGRYRESLHALVSLRKPVDDFFDGVMVMAPEEDVRANRLALLNAVVVLFKRVADLSCLQDAPVSKA